METPIPFDEQQPTYVSTGHLPSVEQVRELVTESHRRFKSVSDGRNSQVYPALANVPSDLFGICVAATNGSIFAVGDAEHEFSIMSVSKPFLFALICDLIGPDDARAKLGVNSTGLPFNSLAGIERSPDGRTNPMVNAGAIATTSLVPGETTAAKWKFIHDGLSRFAGRQLSLNEEVYASASVTNFRNRSIASMLQSLDRIWPFFAALPTTPYYREVQGQVDLDNITFVSNDRLESVMTGTSATPEQVAEAVRVNTEARLRALKIGLILMAGLALLTIIPAGQLPNYRPGEVPADQPRLGKLSA